MSKTPPTTQGFPMTATIKDKQVLTTPTSVATLTPIISTDNQLMAVSPFFTSNQTLINYANWLDSQDNPAKSYRNHPIDSEEQLNELKKGFEKAVGVSLGAYLRIKRAYFVLNHKQLVAGERKGNNKGEENHCHSSYNEFSYISTPIGTMLAIFYQDKLCLLEFLERKSLETELLQLQKEKQGDFQFIPTKQNPSAKILQSQLDEYFLGKRKRFQIAMDPVGTEFQKEVWQTLQGIDYGSTISYQQEAEQMGKPTAMRAVANANSKNKISIIIPCHRVIRKSGDLGGYGGGLWRKRFLLALEGLTLEDDTETDTIPANPSTPQNNLHDIQNRLINFNQERNWDARNNPKNIAMSIGIESAELMEIFQWYSTDEANEITDPAIIEHIGEEIADVMIYCLSLASTFGLNFVDIIEDKIKKNSIKYPVKK